MIVKDSVASPILLRKSLTTASIHAMKDTMIGAETGTTETDETHDLDTSVIETMIDEIETTEETTDDEITMIDGETIDDDQGLLVEHRVLKSILNQ